MNVNKIFDIDALKTILFYFIIGKGEYSGIIQELWREKMNVDFTFGCGHFKAKFDPKCIDKVRLAITKKIICPYTNLEDCLMVNIFNLGCFWWFRGCDELLKRTWDEVAHGKTDGRDRTSISMLGEQKSNKLKNTKNNPCIQIICPNVVYAHDPKDVFCPVRLIKAMETFRDPNATYIKSDADYLLFKESETTGEEKFMRMITKDDLDKYCKKLAQVCGFDNPDDSTCHGNRAFGSTVAASNAQSLADQKLIIEKSRHKHVSTFQEHYNKPSEDSRQQFQMSLANLHSTGGTTNPESYKDRTDKLSPNSEHLIPSSIRKCVQNSDTVFTHQTNVAENDSSRKASDKVSNEFKQSEIDLIRSSVFDVKLELEATKAKLKRTESELVESKSEVRNWEIANKNWSDEKIASDQDYQQYRYDLERIRKKYKEAESEVEHLASDNKKKRKLIKSLSSENAKLSSKNARLSSKNAKKQKLIDRYENDAQFEEKIKKALAADKNGCIVM